jgi:hypothetical protein
MNYAKGIEIPVNVSGNIIMIMIVGLIGLDNIVYLTLSQIKFQSYPVELPVV